MLGRMHDKDKVQRRLKKIAGQVAGIQRMIDDDRYCIDVVMQVSAVRAALSRVGEAILERHFQTCLTEAFESGTDRDRQEKIAELMKVFARHGSA